MARAQKANTFQSGQADGTTITVGNSGGGAGDAFNNVTVGASAQGKYSTTNPKGSETLDGSFGSNAATANSAFGEYTGLDTGAAIPDTHYGRAYLYIDASPGATTQIIRFRDTANAVLAQIQLTTTRTIILKDAAGGTLYTSAALSTGTWVRIEWRMKHDTSTTGEFEIKIWTASPESTGTPDITTNQTAKNMGITVMAKTSFGVTVGANYGTLTGFRLTDIVTGAATWPGPSGGTKAIAGAAINATSSLTASGVGRIRPTTVAALTATSAIAASVVRIRLAGPAGLVATSAITANVVARRAVKPVGLVATSALTVSTVGRIRPTLVAAITGTSAIAANLVAKRAVSGATIVATSLLTANAIARLRRVQVSGLISTSTLTMSLAAQRAIRPSGLVATSSVTASVLAIVHVIPGGIVATSTIGTIRITEVLPAISTGYIGLGISGLLGDSESGRVLA